MKILFLLLGECQPESNDVRMKYMGLLKIEGAVG